MKLLKLACLLLFASFAYAQDPGSMASRPLCPPGVPNCTGVKDNLLTMANEATTGTVQYHNVRTTTENPVRAIHVSTADAVAGSGTIGICILNCGTTGNAVIAYHGIVPCVFDGATVSNDYVGLSTTQAGKCADLGPTRPLRNRIVGRVLSTNASAGTYDILMAGLGLRGSVDLPAVPTGLCLKDDGSAGSCGSGGSTPTGTGFRHVTVGVEDGASSFPDWADVTGKPATFAPSAHSHPESDVTNLVADLAGKAASSHTHVKADITDFGTYEAPLTFSGALNRSVNTITCNTASGTVFGCLTAADWTTFNGKQAALGFTPENSANKNAANGYAGLSSGLLSAAQLPLPAASTLGGVKSKTCSGTDKLNAIGTDGLPVCGTDSTGSTVAFREFFLCPSGCAAWTNLGAGPTEMASQTSRTFVDLSNFTDVKVIANFSVTATTGDIRLECADTTAFASLTTLLQFDNPGANTMIEGSFAAIPAGCKTSGGVYIRAVGINGNGTEDPAARFIKIQVR